MKQSRGHDSQADVRLLALEADVKGRMLKSVQGMDRFNRWVGGTLVAQGRIH